MDTSPPPVEDEEIELVATRKAGEENLYTLLEGETIWSVARRFGYNVEELAEHNDIDKEDMFIIQEGFTLHLPIARQIVKQISVTYEPFAEPRLMHVVKDSGTTKWSFAHVRGWGDIKTVGRTYRKNSVVTIVALAKVPIGGEIAAYYVDDISYNSIPRRTMGFKWRDLNAGKPEIDTSTIEKSIKRPLNVTQESTQLEQKSKTPTWKEQLAKTWSPFETGPVKYKVKERTLAVYLDYTRDPKPLDVGRPLNIGGTFMLNGRLMGRIYEAMQKGLLWAVDMNKLQEDINILEDEEIYATVEPIQTQRLAFRNGRLTLEERVVVVPLSKLRKQRRNMLDVFYKLKKG